MINARVGLVVCVLACLLSACATLTTPPAAPTAAQVLPILPAQQETAVVPPTQTIPSPTSIPATVTPLPPTETSIPGPVITLSQIHMLDTTNGWAWGPMPNTNDPTSTVYRLLRSADGGQTWLDVSPKPNSPGYYGGFFLNDQVAWIPYSDPTTYAVNLLRTLDGGKTWEALPPNDILQMGQVQFTSPNDGILETAGVGAGNKYLNYYDTHDGGASWKPILLAAPNPEPGLPPGTIHLCNICGDSLYYDPERMVIVYGSMANDPSGAVPVAISTDMGQHWKNIKLPLPEGNKYVKGMVAPQQAAFFGQTGILPVNIMEYSSDGSVAYSVLTVYTSTDGGQNWTISPNLLETNSNFDTVQVISGQIAFARCGKNLCATDDGARTWQTLPNSLDFDMANGGPEYVGQFAFISRTEGWAIAGQDPNTNLWKTSNGGLTWVNIFPTLAGN